jgi:hypothetical protein
MIFQDLPNKPLTLGDLPPYPFGFLPTGESEGAYFESLGRFIAAYANAEASVHDLTRTISKLSEDKARVIFAGMRLSELATRVRAMLRSDKADEATYNEIDACLVQLDTIAEDRNRLVHRSINYIQGQFHVTNMYTARTQEGIEFHRFTKTALDDMAYDCRSIFLRLLAVSHPETTKNDPPIFAELLKQPWRYKPAQPSPPKKPRRKVPQQLPPQPDASGG